MDRVLDRRAEAAELFREHIAAITRTGEKSLAVSAEIARDRDGRAVEYGGIVFHAGTRTLYHAQDAAVPFRPLPHFSRFAPIEGPDHLLVFRPGEPIRLGMVVPADYRGEARQPTGHPFEEILEVVEAPSLEAVALLLGDVSSFAYLGDDPTVARRLGIARDAVEPRSLTAPLDWYRGFKTPYEVACLSEAALRAALGHAAAREGCEAGASEREIHAAYLAATGHLDLDTPYPNIIAWDDRAAVLRYTRKRVAPPDPGQTFLIDAGATCYGYASEVTRTYVHPGVHPVFREALDSMETLQQRLVGRVGPGLSSVELHAEAVRGVSAILRDLGILRVGEDEALASRLALAFLPHGVAHHLGLQVPDVGGRQVTREGEMRPPPEEHPHLQTTRELAAGHVVAVGPGLYFIPRAHP